MNGNDLFVNGNIGSASSVYTNGAFVAGAGSTPLEDGLSQRRWELHVASAADSSRRHISVVLGSSTVPGRVFRQRDTTSTTARTVTGTGTSLAGDITRAVSRLHAAQSGLTAASYHGAAGSAQRVYFRHAGYAARIFCRTGTRTRTTLRALSEELLLNESCRFPRSAFAATARLSALKGLSFGPPPTDRRWTTCLFGEWDELSH